MKERELESENGVGEDNAMNIYENLSLEIKAGQTVALCGQR